MMREITDNGKTIRTQRAVTRACTEGARLFATKGYTETTTRELAAAMDVTNGTFYYYFPSKEDLLQQISMNALEEITSAVNNAVKGAKSGTEAISLLIHAHLKTIVNSRDSHTTMLLGLRSLAGENRAAVIEARDQYSKLVRGVLERARRDGSLTTRIEIATLTLLLLNLLNWTIFWYRPELSLSYDELADRVVDLFLNGVARAA
jgi:AcrR family transcriptional regulator